MTLEKPHRWQAALINEQNLLNKRGNCFCPEGVGAFGGYDGSDGLRSGPRLHLTHRIRRFLRNYVEDAMGPPTNIEPLTNPVLPCATAMQAREYPVHEQHSRAQ